MGCLFGLLSSKVTMLGGNKTFIIMAKKSYEMEV